MPFPAIVEYVWLSGRDAHHDIRSKCKVIWQKEEKDIVLSDCHEWNFDGSSTGQAQAGHDTEVIVRPCAIWKHPFITETRAWVVISECYYPNGQPTPDNSRAVARSIFEHEKCKDMDPWFGLEQEMVLMKDRRPFGWPRYGFPAPQGPYYCATGPFSVGRDLSNRHLCTCVNMGLNLSGTNAEVMPGQWEYQVGPCQGIDSGDHMIMSRWVFLRLMEELNEPGVDVSFDVKPVKGDWNGSGMHCNFSTTAMRNEGGLDEIETCLKRMSQHIAKDVRFYSTHNNERMTGAHETSKLTEFTYGVGTRHTSARIPNAVAKDKKGYMEDRRPGGDADPYLVTARCIASAYDIPSQLMDAYAVRLKQDWMPEIPGEEKVAAPVQEVKQESTPKAPVPGKNCALVFVKPHAVTDAVLKLVPKALDDAKIEIMAEGEVKGETIAEEKIIDKHYAAIARYAVEWTADKLTISETVQKTFETQFGVSWSDAIKQGNILNAVQTCEKLGGLTPSELAAKWQSNTGRLKLAPGLYVTKFADEGFFVLNGFYLANREKFAAPGKIVHWYIVNWNESDLKWQDFRAKVIGPTNPENAPEGSMRGVILKNWQELGLPACPNVSDNGVHASAGPLEGFAERMIWLGTPFNQDAFAKAVAEAGVPEKLLQEWVANPLVQINEVVAPAFDQLEDMQTSDVIAALQHAVEEEKAALKIQSVQRAHGAKKKVDAMRQQNNKAEGEQPAEGKKQPTEKHVNPTPPPETTPEDIKEYATMQLQLHSPPARRQMYRETLLDKFTRINCMYEEADLRELFHAYDKDGSGTISRTEFKADYMNLEDFGLKPTETEVDALFTKYDSSKDGKLNYDEFAVLMLERVKY